MIAGTGSDVGKSVICTALCRIFLQDGYCPAPFKAQNMALNSFATPDGHEIGRAQAVQAEACGLPASTDMNPILLKPNSEHTTQVVLNGRPVGNRDAYDYFRREGREELRSVALEAFKRLKEKHDPVVMEGAGSVSELNLRESDIANIPMARLVDAPVLLVADIDRGGVFASCYGSVMLQEPRDRELIKGIIINKFRGDLRLFQRGREMMEAVCHVPVLGVVPYYSGIVIDEEDSVELERKRRSAMEGRVNVAVLLLQHISNFTDFGALERDPRFNLYYTRDPRDVEEADILIVPGTKSTMDDLLSLRRDGLAGAVLRRHEKGRMTVGICGGFQMMGQVVSDPHGVEGTVTSLPGLGILPITTIMQEGKTTRQTAFFFHGVGCTGYEIHQGESHLTGGEPIEAPYIEQGGCLGTYIHGFFDNKVVRDYLIEGLRGKGEGRGDDHEPTVGGELTAGEFRQRQYDLLAEHVRKHVDMEAIYRILRQEPPR